MILRSNFHWTAATAFAAIVSCAGLNQLLFAQPNLIPQGEQFEADGPADAPPDAHPDGEAGPEILTRGPVHEAFAETVNFDPEPGVVVPKSPPEPIEEMPPDQKPEGDNVDWVPGYWAWDDERDDFLWISGIWRDLPPGRQWVSGYWTEADGGAQWISGYWADADVEDTEYLPEPPESVEAGPNIEAPSPDQTWLPGTWVWQRDRYFWRPGYWTVVQPNWVWVPDHFVWTPMGYVFVNGYWDYVPMERGIVFAPVYVSPVMYRRRGFIYSPSYALDMDLFTAHLFVRPNYCHYYFGDYYAVSYADSGYYPWFEVHHHHCYDPFFAHRRWEHRRDRNWAVQIELDFRNKRDHKENRPPRTWMAQKEMMKRDGGGNKKNMAMAVSIDQMAKRKDGHIKLVSLNKQQREKVQEQGKELRKLRQERKQLEKQVAKLPDNNGPDNKDPKNKGPNNKGPNNKDLNRNDPNKDPKNSPGPKKVKIPKSTIVGKRIDQVEKAKDLPKKITAPKTDVNVEPKVRKQGQKNRNLNKNNGNPGNANQGNGNPGNGNNNPPNDPKNKPKNLNKQLNNQLPNQDPTMKIKPKDAVPKVREKAKMQQKGRNKNKPKPDPDKDKDKDQPPS